MKEENVELTEEIEEMEGEIKETGISTRVTGFGIRKSNSKTEINIETNITDEKKIFNLDSHVDAKLNDCKGELIRVKEVLMKTFVKPLEEPEVDVTTGEIRDREIKRVTILIDDNGKSYVTASKSFALQLRRYIEMFGTATMENEGLEIKIIEVPVKNSNNKALGFELV